MVPPAPLSMGFSRQEYWSELPFPPPGHLPDPGIKPASPASPVLQIDSLQLSHLGSKHTIYRESILVACLGAKLVSCPPCYLAENMTLTISLLEGSITVIDGLY